MLLKDRDSSRFRCNSLTNYRDRVNISGRLEQEQSPDERLLSENEKTVIVCDDRERAAPSTEGRYDRDTEDRE